METDTGIEKSLRTNLNDEIRKSISKGQYKKALELSSELNFVAPLSGSWLSAEVFDHRGNYEACADALSQIIDRADAPAEQKAMAPSIEV